METTITNEDVTRDILKTLPEEFYGEVTLQFHKGLITHTKTVHQKKYNTSKATSPEAFNANSNPRK